MSQLICFVSFLLMYILAFFVPPDQKGAAFFISIIFLLFYFVLGALAEIRRAITDLGRRP